MQQEQGDILVVQLRQHNLDIDPTATPADITTEALYHVLLSGLQTLGALTASDRRKRFPSQLPTATASRFAVAQSLVSVLNGAGCTAIGYDHVVYPVEASTKAVLQWLVAELGRASEAEAQRHELREEDESTLTELQRRCLALQRAVGPDSKGSKQPKATIVPRTRKAPVRGAAAAGGAVGSQAYWCVAATAFDAEQPASVLGQAVTEYKAVQRTHTFLGDVAKPTVEQVSVNTLCEVHCAMLATTKAFSKVVAPILVSGRSDAVPTVQWQTHTALAQRFTAHRRKAKQLAVSIESMFYNSCEAGLVDEATSLASKKAKQAAEDAAAAAVEADKRSAEDREAKIEEEELTVKEQLHRSKQILREKTAVLQQLTDELELARARIQELKLTQQAQEASTTEQWEAAQERQKLLSLMDDAEGSEAAIVQRIAAIKEQRRALKESTHGKLLKVEKKREQLVEENNVNGEGREEQIAAIRQQIKEAKLKVKQRGREVRALQADYAKCPKDIDRSGFLRLIFDMTANIRKQHQQLESVRRDMSDANTAIAALEEKISVLFTSLESKMYASASGGSSGASGKHDDKHLQDDFSRNAYRNVVDVQESYTALVEAIRARGVAMQELHELDEKVGKLQRLVGAYDTQQMSQDLAALQEENTRLNEELEALQQQS